MSEPRKCLWIVDTLFHPERGYIPAQLRMINTSLAREEAEDHHPDDRYSQALMDRTRAVVHAALDKHKAWGDDE